MCLLVILWVSVCCNLSLAGALLQSEGELDCDVFQFRSALQSEQCSQAECQRVWRWQWSPSVTSPSLLPASSLWRCSPIKSFMIISQRTVWSLAEWKQWRLNFTWSKCTNSNYRREFNILSGTCTNVRTQLPRQKRQLFWSGLKTTEWTYERVVTGYWRLDGIIRGGNVSGDDVDIYVKALSSWIWRMRILLEREKENRQKGFGGRLLIRTETS